MGCCAPSHCIAKAIRAESCHDALRMTSMDCPHQTRVVHDVRKALRGAQLQRTAIRRYAK